MIKNENRIKKACEQAINRHKSELIEINLLLDHINNHCGKEINWIKSKLYQRIDELEIAVKSTSHAPWSTFEIKWLKDNYSTCTARELAIDMERSTATVKKMIYNLGLKKR